MSTEDWNRPMEPGPIKIEPAEAPARRNFQLAQYIFNLEGTRHGEQRAAEAIARFERSVKLGRTDYE